MSKKNPNIFHDTDLLDYYPTPALSPETLKSLSLRGFRLYHFILAKMKRKRSFSLILTIKEIQEGTGIHRQDLGAVKEELKSLNLITSSRQGRDTVWTAMHPLKGAPVRYLSYLERDSLTADEIVRYFTNRLGQTAVGHTVAGTSNGMRATCPFCDKKRSLHIRLPKEGQLDGGVWKCHSCQGRSRAEGNILDFEEELIGRKPYWGNRPIREVKNAARRSVEAFLQKPEQTNIEGNENIEDVPESLQDDDDNIDNSDVTP